NILIGQLILGVIVGIISASPFIYKAIKVYLKHSTLEKSMVQVGESVYHALYHIGKIKTRPEDNVVYAEKKIVVICYLETGTTHEQKLFLKSLQEVVDPIENPRYLLCRKSRKYFIFKRRDYHAVP